MKMEVGSVSAAKRTKEGKWGFSKLLWSFPHVTNTQTKAPERLRTSPGVCELFWKEPQRSWFRLCRHVVCYK